MILELAGLGAATVWLLGSALMVVTQRNLVHAVFWLASAMVATAVVFLFLHAPFLAAIQLLLYTGGVITLMLFGVMLTNRHEGVLVPNDSEQHLVGAGTAGAVLALFLTGIWRSDGWWDAPVDTGSAVDVGRIFLTEHLLAFEALSVLLLAAMIGAIVLSRNTDP